MVKYEHNSPDTARGSISSVKLYMLVGCALVWK